MIERRTDRRPWRGALAILIAAAGVIAAQAGDAAVLVLRAHGPGAQARFQPGKPIRPGERIKLAAQEWLMLLDNGGTRSLDGPGQWVLDERKDKASGRPAPGRLSALMEYAIVDGRERRIAMAAAVRSPVPGGGADEAGGPAADPGAAQLAGLVRGNDIYDVGHVCVWGDAVGFFQGRGGARDDAPATLLTATGPILVRFTGGRSEPIAIDRLTGGKGVVTVETGGTTREARFTRIAAPQSLEELAAAAAKAGCDDTLSLIWDRFRVEE